MVYGPRFGILIYGVWVSLWDFNAYCKYGKDAFNDRQDFDDYEKRENKMEFRDVLEFERENADSTIQKCGSLLQHLPKGKLSVQTKNGRKYYRKSKDGIQTNLKHGDRQIELLAGRRVAEIALQNASYDKTMLDKIIKSYKTYNPNEITESLSPAYHNITPDIIEAMGFPYLLDFDESTCAEELHPEHLTQTDSSGNKRRSKSELSINAVYHELNMKPIYEYELVLPDGFVFHPDFTIM